jgi:predicted GNAT family acetyltransferase
MEMANVTNNEKKSQFEYVEDGHTAVAAYTKRPDALILTHTEVPKELGGRGIGNKLAEFAMTYAREHDLRVVPLCPFMSKYIDKHPEHKDLVRS